jgi:hypothetical protein
MGATPNESGWEPLCLLRGLAGIRTHLFLGESKDDLQDHAVGSSGCERNRLGALFSIFQNMSVISKVKTQPAFASGSVSRGLMKPIS